MEAEGSAPAGPSGSGGVRGAGEAERGVAGGSAPIASVSTSAKDDVKAFNLEKFYGEDWASWSFMIKLLFNHYGLLEVMDGELKRPASEGETNEWDHRSKDGFFLLSQCLSSNQFKAMVVVLERQLHAVKINAGDAVQGAFDQLWNLYVKLSAAGVNYPEKIKCYTAFSLLPESWDPLVVNLNGMKDPWSLEWIRAQVLQEEFRRKELTASAGEGGGSAYGMKGFKGRGSKKGKAKEGTGGEQYLGGKRGSKGGKRYGGICWYCHVEGHLWFKCRKLSDGWRPGQPSIEGSKGVHGAMGECMGSEEGDGGAGGHDGMFYHVGEACSEDMVVLASKVSLHRSSHWDIDTGAFMTITNRDDLLDEFRPSKAAIVVSATGQVVSVRGEGRAMFMSVDGRLVGLKHVHLVPGLCANLLPTKALSEAGMKIEMMGTKVFKATLDGRVLWDLRGGKDMHRSIWEIPVLPSKEAAARLAAEAVRGGRARHVTSGGGGDGSDGGLLVHRGGVLPSHWVPMKNWSGKKPLVDMLRVFWCMALVHVPKEKCDKLQAAAMWAVHLGLARGSNGWLMWDPKSNTIFTIRDSKFMEGLMFKEWSERGRSKVTILLGIEVGTNDSVLIPIELSSSSELTEVSHDLGGAEGEAADVEGVLQQGEAPVAERGKRDAVRGGAKEGAAKERPKRASHPRDFLKYERLGGPKALLVREEEDEEEKGAEGEMEQILCFGVNLPHEPASMEEALGGDDREAWLASREDEFQSHLENETWTLKSAPRKECVGLAWVLCVNTDAEGRLERRKTRLVIKGFQQREGIDFQEVFAPVAKAPTLRQPEGYDDGSGRVCRINKAIYGLRQAPRCWYARQVEAFETIGFKVSGCDKSLFMTEGEEEEVVLLVYVDDILLFSPSLERIKEVQGKLKETFKCKVLGPMGYYLGLHVEQDEVKGWLRLHQHKYLAAMGEKYGLEEGRSVKTPLPSGFQLHLDEAEGEVLEYELQRRLQSMGEQEGTVGDHEPSVQVLGPAGHVVTVAAAPPPLASAAMVPAPATAPVAPPLPSPVTAAAVPAAATGTPALPSPTAVVTPLLSPAVPVTAHAAAGGTPDLPSPGAAVTPPLRSPSATAPAPVAAPVTPPLLYPAAAANAPTTAVVNPPLLSPAAAVSPPLLSPAAMTEIASATATAAAAVPSQNAHAPPSPTGGDISHGSGNIQCAV
ncbi:unnamed protein product [Closterium sp. NIES-53]